MAITSLPQPHPVEPGVYQPPIAEFGFLLEEAFGTDIVSRASDGAMNADDARDVLTAAGEYAAEALAPLNRMGDEEGACFTDGRVELPSAFAPAYRSFTESGWLAAAAPESAGGDGLPESVSCALTEFWNSANMAFALNPMLSLGAIRALNATGSEPLKARYLPKLVSGEWTGTMNLTEPQAGSDLAAVRSIARDNGDGSWSLTGQKIFITWGDHELAENIVHLVLARTEGAPEGHRGISLFLVPKFLPNADGRPGERNAVTTLGIEHKIGIHASPTCTLQFDNATAYLVGELHQGLPGMFVMMNEARFGMGVQGIGIAQRAYQRAADYAHSRVQGSVLGLPAGTPIAGHPDVRRLLLSMASRISAMRAFAVFAADLRDRSHRDPSLRPIAELCTPLLKSWATEEATHIASDAIQVHGGMGYIEETGAAQHWRDSRIAAIYEGTTAIQANDLLGRKVLRDSGTTLGECFSNMRDDLQLLRSLPHPAASRSAERLERALAAAERATARVIELSQDPRDAYAVAVPYQELLAVLCGGWMHAKIVIAVLRHDALTAEDQRRLTEADCYGAHQLSRVHALAETVAAGEID